MLIEALAADDAHVVSLCGAGGKTTLMFALAREFITKGERVLLTTTTKIASDEAAAWPWPSFAATDVDSVLEGARRLLRHESRTRAAGLIVYSAASADGKKLVGFASETVDAISESRQFDRILVEADGSARKPLKAPAAHEPVIPSSTDAVIIVAGLAGLGLPLREEHVFRPDIWTKLTGVARGAPVTPESLAQIVIHPEGVGKGSPPHARRALFLNRADTPERLAAAKRVFDLLTASGSCRLNHAVAGCLLPEPVIVGVVSFR